MNKYNFFCLFVILLFLLNDQVHCQNITSCPQDKFGDECDYILCEEKDLPFKQCKNNGKCIKKEQPLLNNSMSFKCLCDLSQYSGALCEIPLCVNYCYNDGICKNEKNSTTCDCKNTHFDGDRCQFNKCTDKCDLNCFQTSTCACKCKEECDLTYCNNKNGTCYLDSNDKLACKCAPGFIGPTCSINKCNGYCFNGGTCIPAENGEVSCKCSNDFGDIRCSKKSTKIPTEYRARKNMFYAISITIIICLIAIGAYYSLQKGYLDRVLPLNLRSKLSDLNDSNASEANTSTRSNIQFNKLIEDEVIQNDEV